MKLYFVLFLATVLAIQAEAFVSPKCKKIYKEYTPKINAEKSNITQIVKDQTKNIKGVKKIINDIADEAQSLVNDDVKTLNKLVSDSKWKAVKQWKNINKCVKNQKNSINGVNTKDIEMCRMTRQDENSLKSDIKKLEKLGNGLSDKQKKCLKKNPWYPLNLIDCLDDLLNKTEREIAQTVTQTENKVELKKEKSDSCVGKMLGILDVTIGNITDTFSDCVGKILK